MKSLITIAGVVLSLAAAWAQSQASASLRGVVTDPSGAIVPGALVQLRGPGGEQRSYTGGTGEYAFCSLRPGKYVAPVIVKGFSVTQRSDFDIAGPMTLDFQLSIADRKSVV